MTNVKVKEMNAKETALAVMLSVLGTVLSAISLGVVPLFQGVALDLSHVATFVAAIIGGPFLGAFVGFMGGIYAGYYFGFSTVGGLGFLSLIGIPLGKAMTGGVAGFLYRRFKLGASGRSALAIPATLLAYVPESVYTVLYFLFIVTLVNAPMMTFMIPLVIPKGWFEIAVMSILMSALAGNSGFSDFVNRFFYVQKDKISLGRNKNKPSVA